ncbi:MAG: hypothetical protein KDC84_15365 [Crocinitomicaceae bacterium]|nr:hypothetical protein [Crocinitomicaceae bacterium]
MSNILKSILKGIIWVYLKIRRKKTYWSIAVPYFLFIFGELTKASDKIVHLLNVSAANAENIIAKSVFGALAFWYNLSIPLWCTLVISALFIFVSVIKILENRGTKNVIYILNQYGRNLSKGEIKQHLNLQTNRQLKKEIASGKYIPDTFIETRDIKDQLRYLTDSIFFSEKIIEETKNLDFRLLNRKLQTAGKPIFNFSINQYEDKVLNSTPDSFCENLGELITYLENKLKEIKDIEISNNEIYKFERKISDKIEELSSLKSRIALITEHAGQGKTNLVCDLVHTFLLKRNIPTTFVVGYELESDDIRGALMKRIFPDLSNVLFEDFILGVKEICEEESTYYTLVIDGLNENPNPSEFSKELEQFISEMQHHKFVKMVLTCRTEYFENNFTNIKNAAFSSDLKYIESLNSHLDETSKKRLYNAYLSHFNVKIKHIRTSVYEQLIDNFLLLRIFSESHQNRELDSVEDIYKEALFNSYYKLKCDEINNRLKDNDDFNIGGNFDIRNFLEKIVQFMLENEVYSNIPLDSIVAEKENREIYIRFLDENILMKRDLNTNETVFGTQESVSFTFDEFRDYTLSKYLIEAVWNKSKEEFKSIVQSRINEESVILEGCSSFLFYFSKRLRDTELNDFLLTLPWYNVAFIRGIFSFKYSEITTADIDLIKKLFKADSKFSLTITKNLMYRRYNLNSYGNLSINILFELFRSLSEEEYDELVSSNFYFGHRSPGVSYRAVNLESHLEELLSITTEKEFTENESYHTLYEMLIYLIPISYSRILYVYETYWYRNKKVAYEQLMRANENCKSERLNTLIKQFMQEYEIRL